MPRPSRILIGQLYGRLTVMSLPYTEEGKRRVKVTCVCGTVKEVFPQALLQGTTVSCGCHRSAKAKADRTTHGKFGTRIYRIWSGMLDRCRNPKNKDKHNYMGRGISVCPGWKSFETFYSDMGDPPTPTSTLERKDNNKGYNPDNCKWSTPTEQARNRRDNLYFTYEGRTQPLSAWVEELKLNYRQVWQRMVYGKKSFERALELPFKEGVPETFWKPLKERLKDEPDNFE